MNKLLASIMAVLVLSVTAFAGSGIRAERVQFAKGSTSVVIKGKLKGDADIDYMVNAGAGQTIAVSLKGSNRMNFFNVLPPGSDDVAMYVGDTGEDYSGMLPDDGDYKVRVYLVRAAARRNESSDYTMTISVTGRHLAPVPASQDALVPGTRFHASANITGLTYIDTFGDKAPKQCQAFVIRRGTDGTATVEIPQGSSAPRRILFVQGKPAASDSSSQMTFARRGDVTIVTFEGGEFYEIPDAFVFGG